MLIRPLEQIVPIANWANASDPTTRNVPTPPPLPPPSTNSASNTEASKSSLRVSLGQKKMVKFRASLLKPHLCTPFWLIKPEF